MAQENTSDPLISPGSAHPSGNIGTISLTKKKRIRGGYRAHSTRLINDSLAEIESEQHSKLNVVS